MIAVAAVLAVALSGNHNGGNNPPPPPPRSAPAPVRPAPPPPGFNLPHDVPQHAAPPAHPAQPAPHPAQPPPRVVMPPRPIERPVQPLPHYQVRPPASGPRVPNPHNWTQPWQWNSGVAWTGAMNYWGWGFWGPWAIGLSAGAYFVQPESPGAELLQEYGLTQTPCGPPNLVEIFGPDGSEICAFPNQLVGPGQYGIDLTTLTLISYGPGD
jgi:hypothetical protein